MAEDDLNPPSLLPGENTEAITGEIVPRHPNLRPPWKKGQTGNRGGRPKSKPLAEALRKQLGKKVPPDMLAKLTASGASVLQVIGKRPTYADLLAWALIQQGLKGNIAAIARIFDRTEGKIPREVLDADDGMLDQLMDVLAMAPAAPGEVNE